MKEVAPKIKSESNAKPEQELPILTFDEFCMRSHNFFSYFENDGRGDIYRNLNSFYTMLEEADPRLVTKLKREIPKRNKSILIVDSLKPYFPDLYKAYKIMRKLGASDLDLFT